MSRGSRRSASRCRRSACRSRRSGFHYRQLGLPPVQRSERLRTTRTERLGRSDRRGAILFVPAFGWPYLPETAVPGPPAPPPQEEHATGRLRLDIRPGVDPQIYVDGYYVGMLSDVSGELTLDIGTHTLELREDGYENLRVDVQISTDGLITYRGELKPVGGTDLPVRGAACHSAARTFRSACRHPADHDLRHTGLLRRQRAAERRGAARGVRRRSRRCISFASVIQYFHFKPRADLNVGLYVSERSDQRSSHG